MDFPHFGLFLAAATVLAISPGPGLFYVAARALSGGRAEGVASSFGTALGGMAHVVAGALGVSALVLASAKLFAGLKLLGAAYLVWLGTRAILSARREALGLEAAKPMGARRAFREGVWVEALNPKTAAFFLAFIPQFLNPADGSVTLQFAALGAVSVALNTLADIAVVYAASAARQGASARPGLVRRLREGSGAAMIVLGLGLGLARRSA